MEMHRLTYPWIIRALGSCCFQQKSWAWDEPTQHRETPLTQAVLSSNFRSLQNRCFAFKVANEIK